ncbi:hypothetical protein SAMN05216289_104134 [Dokdonella immobilis]|uniref:Uncharacterized protein n=2 Tax=Dokdonella immobilis TaxID=578942 RepID=A0A1I4WC71_9GAMM|nr:hypothetical protein SAMN05216289_104134 [Dokdonella immobilis]
MSSIWIMLGLLAAGISTANAGAPSSPIVLLEADFNNKPAGLPIGTGDAELNEPADLGGLSTTVIEDSAGENHLRVINQSGTTSARRIKWGLLGDAEVSSGTVRIEFDFTPSELDFFSILVREQGSAGSNFLNLNVLGTGSISASTAAGTIALANNGFSAGARLHFDLRFDLDNGTVTLANNDRILALDQPTGVSGSGIGTLYIGYPTGSGGAAFDLDNVHVQADRTLRTALYADFDEAAVGSGIGTGGAEVGEPIFIAPALDTEIISQGSGDNALALTSTNTSSAQSSRWQLLDDIGIAVGTVVVEFDVAFGALGSYNIGVREANGSARVFTTIAISGTGGAGSISDAGGTVSAPGLSYVVNQTYHFRLAYDMEAGTYDVSRDGVPLVSGRAHGVASGIGIGRLAFGIANASPSPGPMILDNLEVSADRVDRIGSDIEFLRIPGVGLPNAPLTPALEVAVVNVFDEGILGGSPVVLDVVSGPPGAVLLGTDATTYYGLATFADLIADSEGIYVLRATSDALTRTADRNIAIINAGDLIFREGFDGD